MRLDVVDNEGAATMIAELRKELGSCMIARLATASLTRDGIKFIEEALKDKHRELQVRLLIGLYNGHTEPAALRRLLRMLKKSDERLEVRIAENPRFHWKMYFFKRKVGVTAFIGSSNLTGDGLGAAGEINVRLTDVGGRGALNHLGETFDRIWSKHSSPLEAKIVEVFSPAFRQSREATRQIDPLIKQVLRTPQRTLRKKQLRTEPRIITYFDEFADRTTKRMVMDKTAWDGKGWDWMVYPRQTDRDRLRAAGSFYLAELHGNGGHLSLNDVRDEDDFKTEDGRYFVAYQKRKGSISRNLTPSVLSRLKQEGVIKKKEDLHRDRRISRAHREVLDRLLRVPHK